MIELRYLQKYRRESDGFDGGKSFQTSYLVPQHRIVYGNTEEWQDIPIIEDLESKNNTQDEDYTYPWLKKQI